MVSDDGRDYAPLLAAAAIEDPRIRHCSSGAAQNTRNAGLALAQGRFVAPLDAGATSICSGGWIEGWDPAIDLCDDLALNLKIFAKQPRIPVVSAVLHDYRIRQGSVCHAPDSAVRAENDYRTLLKRLYGDGYGLDRHGCD